MGRSRWYSAPTRGAFFHRRRFLLPATSSAGPALSRVHRSGGGGGGGGDSPQIYGDSPDQKAGRSDRMRPPTSGVVIWPELVGPNRSGAARQRHSMSPMTSSDGVSGRPRGTSVRRWAIEATRIVYLLASSLRPLLFRLFLPGGRRHSTRFTTRRMSYCRGSLLKVVGRAKVIVFYDDAMRLFLVSAELR